MIKINDILSWIYYEHNGNVEKFFDKLEKDFKLRPPPSSGNKIVDIATNKLIEWINLVDFKPFTKEQIQTFYNNNMNKTLSQFEENIPLEQILNMNYNVETFST